MPTKPNCFDSSSRLRKFFLSVFLLLLSILLFALPQPNILTVQGIPILAYIALVPVFLLVRLVSWKTVWLYGFLYGLGSYCLFTYWLATFHPMGILVISGMYGIYLMLTFPLLKAAASLFPKHGWLAQWIVWCGYEYIKTLGFSGFHYGVIAYSHWRWIPMIQCVDLVGVWGLDAFITFFSAWVTKVILDFKNGFVSVSNFKEFILGLFSSIKKSVIPFAAWACVLVAILIYGFSAQVDYSQNEKITVALVQQNSDPWIGGVAAYKRDLNTLINLSNQALDSDENIDLVVWPETAFVPRITWHYQHRYEREKFQLVEQLLDYIDQTGVAFLTGNDHGVDGYTRAGNYDVVDYNAALLFQPGDNFHPPKPEIYSKMKLVPFTEYFPFEKLFPKLYELLLNGDTHMWEPGTEPVVFQVGELKFGTPICFEDTFGFVVRRFVNEGANAIVNISNDAWSNSLPCQYQHLSMAIFRSVENRIPAARATATGQTSFIDPNGRIISMAEPFCETYLIGQMPIKTDDTKTLYTKLGDYVGVFFAIATFVLLATGLILKIKKNKLKK